MLYVKTLSTNLMSVNKISHKGFKVLFDAEKCIVCQDCEEKDGIVIIGTNCNGIYKVGIGLCYQRSDHLKRKYMAILQKQMSLSINFVITKIVEVIMVNNKLTLGLKIFSKKME